MTQRQERRVLNNSVTMQSFESWDFATMTVHPGLPRHLTAEDPALAKECNGVFEIDGGSFRYGGASLQHSKEFSWATPTNDLDDNATQEVSDDSSTPSSTPSDSGFTSDPVLSSSKSASTKSESSPSSAITSRMQTPKDVRKLAPQTTFSPSSPSSSLSSSSSSTHSRQGLWHRVKLNVQRTPNRGRNDYGDEERKQSPQSQVKKKSHHWREQLLGTGVSHT